MERYEHVSEPTACVDLINIILTLQRGLSFKLFLSFDATIEFAGHVLLWLIGVFVVKLAASSFLPLFGHHLWFFFFFFSFAKCVVFLCAPGPFSKCGFVIGNSWCFKCLAHTCLKTCTRRTNEQMPVQQQIVFFLWNCMAKMKTWGWSMAQAPMLIMLIKLFEIFKNGSVTTKQRNGKIYSTVCYFPLMGIKCSELNAFFSHCRDVFLKVDESRI